MPKDLQKWPRTTLWGHASTIPFSPAYFLNFHSRSKLVTIQHFIPPQKYFFSIFQNAPQLTLLTHCDLLKLFQTLEYSAKLGLNKANETDKHVLNLPLFTADFHTFFQVGFLSTTETIMTYMTNWETPRRAPF